MLLALAGVLLRAAIPAGYMPASLADGWFVELCPDGWPAAAVVALFGHEHAHAHHGEQPDSFADCQLGGIAAAAVGTVDIAAALPAAHAAVTPPQDRPAARDRGRDAFRPRGPPNA